MSGSRASQEHIAGNRRHWIVVCLVGGVIALSVALPASATAAGITFIAPPGTQTYPDQSEGPVGYTEAPVAFRTTDTRPTIAIQAEGAGGVQLQCHFDDVHVTQTCGEPGPGCAAVCGSFQPSVPLGPDSDQFTRGHFLAVDLVDADGSPVASMWLDIDVDTTPPVIQLRTGGGVLITTDSGLTPLRPTFTFQVSDSNSVGAGVDAVTCAWGLAATTPAFRPCGSSSGSSTFTAPRLPARHLLYRLQVRATDDFGRPSTASGVYDPVACALSIRRPASLASLLSSGIPTRLRCDATRHAAVAVYAFMVNGDRSESPRGAVANNPVLGQYGLSNKTNTFTASRRLHLFGAARRALRHARSLGLVVAAAGNPDKLLAGIADDSLSYQVLTLHR